MRRKTIIIIAVIILLAGAYAAVRIAARPSLKQYQSEFGFSLDGLKIRIESDYHDNAFQDPCAVYTAKIDGNKEGTVFDPSGMQEGLPDSIKDAIRHINSEAETAGKGKIINISSDAACRSIVLPGSAKDSRAKLDIIYDSTDDLYHIIWQTW